MSRSDGDTKVAGELYAGNKGVAIDLDHPLGIGEDGMVWPSTADTAVKAFYREKNYLNERDCYFRLQDAGVSEVAGFSIPRFVGHDDTLLVVEIGIVAPPRVLDFGKAYLNSPADYPEQSLEDSMAMFAEYYSDEDWDLVLDAVSDLQSVGIFYYDLKPGNIQVTREL